MWIFIQRCSLVVLSGKSVNFQIVYYYRLQIQVSLYFPFPTNPLNQEIQVFSLGIHMADYPEIFFEYLQDQNRPSCCFQLKQKQNIWCLWVTNVLRLQLKEVINFCYYWTTPGAEAVTNVQLILKKMWNWFFSSWHNLMLNVCQSRVAKQDMTERSSN